MEQSHKNLKRQRKSRQKVIKKQKREIYEDKRTQSLKFDTCFWISIKISVLTLDLWASIHDNIPWAHLTIQHLRISDNSRLKVLTDVTQDININRSYTHAIFLNKSFHFFHDSISEIKMRQKICKSAEAA